MRRVFLLILCALLCILPAAALADDPTVGDTVTLGTYNGTPVEWIVVDDQKTSMGTDGMLLVAKDAVYMTTFRSIHYSSSGLPDACDNFYHDAFTDAERAKILPTTVAARGGYKCNDIFRNCTDAALYEDGVFLLSATEYGKYSENIPNPSEFCFFRTETNEYDGIMGVNEYGEISYVVSGQMTWQWGFRPAINVSKEAFATPTPEPTPEPNPAPATGDNAPIVLLALTVLAAAAMLLRRRETN